MKLRLSWVVSAVVVVASMASGQGTLIYDQQSSDESYLGSGARGIQSNQPFGQSFTPALSAMDFIRIHVGDSVNDGLGATIQINLRTNSVSGTVLASTAPVIVTSQFIGTVDFFFAVTVPLTPGTKYYFQPEVVSGGAFSASSGDLEGTMDLVWSRVRGGKSYIVQQSPNATPRAWTQACVVTKSNCDVHGLTPGQTYVFRVAASGTAGQGPWSDESVKMAP